VARRRAFDISEITDERFRNRFWAKVEILDGCWLWTASRFRNGYGRFNISYGWAAGAHVVSYALTNGTIPTGMSVCHHCDNPPCVRPDHLFLGTTTDNWNDAVAKGRVTCPRGTDRPNARLNDDAVRIIRSAPRERDMRRRLAEEYGVSASTISSVRAGQKWRHVQ
jgi:hypothetical protein